MKTRTTSLLARCYPSLHRSYLLLLVGVCCWGAITSRGAELLPAKAEGCLRVATFNVSLNRRTAGQLATDLIRGDTQARRVAAIIRVVQPDVLLLNELDYSADSDHAAIFEQEYLAADELDVLGGSAWPMPHILTAPVNTGVPSSLDLNRNGRQDDPQDAWGYGMFPGQYGMAVLSRFKIEREGFRSFQQWRWSDLPDALRPHTLADGAYHSDAIWKELRLSSKSFWDVPVSTPLGSLHVIASHPTPPAFDGPEDLNGRRNHDEIKLIADYIAGEKYLQDDQGRAGGLVRGASFVVLGDLNSDPVDGGSRHEAIVGLLQHEAVAQYPAPQSQGAVIDAAAQAGANAQHAGPPAQDTADFSDRVVGNLRVDYVLPSADFEIVEAGVFWPRAADAAGQLREPLAECLSASDHHLVWVDIRR